jgi:RNA polymerase sigma factor (sigma-70 family)
VVASGGDRRLVRRLVAGDEEALAEAYGQHASLVYGLALRVTGRETHAADVCEAVFVSLWSQPESFDPTRGSLRAYLGMLAHRRAVELVRSHAADDSEQVTEVADTATVGPAKVEGGRLVEDLGPRVHRAVDRLPVPEREALRLAYFGGHTYRSVASLLGVPEGTAKRQLQMALDRLSHLLAAEGAV